MSERDLRQRAKGMTGRRITALLLLPVLLFLILAGFHLGGDAEEQIRRKNYESALAVLLAQDRVSALDPHSAIHQYPSKVEAAAGAESRVYYAYKLDEAGSVSLAVLYQKQFFGLKKNVIAIHRYYPGGNLAEEVMIGRNGEEISCRQYYDRKRTGTLSDETAGPNGIPPLWDVRTVYGLFPPALTGIRYERSSPYGWEEEYFFDEAGILTDYKTSQERPLYRRTEEDGVLRVAYGTELAWHEFHYNQENQCIFKSAPPNVRNEYTYDDAGRLSSAGDIRFRFNDNDDPEWIQEGEYEARLYYNADHQITKIDYSRGDEVLFEYDEDGRIREIRHTGSSGFMQGWKYEYDRAGRLREKANTYDGGESRMAVYAYY